MSARHCDPEIVACLLVEGLLLPPFRLSVAIEVAYAATDALLHLRRLRGQEPGVTVTEVRAHLPRERFAALQTELALQSALAPEETTALLTVRGMQTILDGPQDYLTPIFRALAA